MCGCYVKTTGSTGSGVLHISTGQTDTVSIPFTIEKGGDENEIGIYH